MNMAGAIGGIGLITLVLVLIFSAIAKKKNEKRSLDNKEGKIYNRFLIKLSYSFDNLYLL